MHCFSPPPSWYEPLDIFDDEPEPDPAPAELLTVSDACVWWTAAPIDTDD